MTIGELTEIILKPCKSNEFSEKGGPITLSTTSEEIRVLQYDSSIEPMVAERSVKTEYLEVQPGQVKGL